MPFDLSVYFVADPSCCAGRPVEGVVLAALKGGVTVLQLRNKRSPRDDVFEQAVRLGALADDFGVPLLINDYPDIALESKARGVHIGQGDMSPAQARALLGAGAVIGLTAFRAEHFAAIERGVVDYAGTGPVYPTQTDKGKPVLGPEGFSMMIADAPVPVVGIGGISAENAGAVIRAGARGVAVMRAISEAPDPEEAARALAAEVRAVRVAQEILNRRAS